MDPNSTPSTFRPYRAYLERADELQRSNPLAAYHLRLFAAEIGVQLRAQMPMAEAAVVLRDSHAIHTPSLPFGAHALALPPLQPRPIWPLKAGRSNHSGGRLDGRTRLRTAEAG